MESVNLLNMVTAKVYFISIGIIFSKTKISNATVWRLFGSFYFFVYWKITHKGMGSSTLLSAKQFRCTGK